MLHAKRACKQKFFADVEARLSGAPDALVRGREGAGRGEGAGEGRADERVRPSTTAVHRLL
jgi:hypothetical protein